MEKSERINNKTSYFSKVNADKMKLRKISDGIWERLIFFFTFLSAMMIIFIFIFILMKAWPVLKASNIGFVTNTGFDGQIRDAYNAPADNPVLEFGVLSLIMGTLTTTLGALIIAIPLGIGTAIVIAEMTKGWVKTFIQSIIRLLAAIPSVIYGLVGLMIVVPFIKKYIITVEMQIAYLKEFQITGNSMLAGIIVLSFMILPIITALSVDAINAVPKKYRDASLALGLSKWRTITKVVIPTAKSGILAGTILGTGRGIGEAIALAMVSGSVGILPKIAHGGVFFLTPVLPLASAVVNKSQAIAVPSIESALFGCGVVLLITTSILSICTKIVETTVRRRQGLD